MRDKLPLIPSGALKVGAVKTLAEVAAISIVTAGSNPREPLNLLTKSFDALRQKVLPFFIALWSHPPLARRTGKFQNEAEFPTQRFS